MRGASQAAPPERGFWTMADGPGNDAQMAKSRNDARGAHGQSDGVTASRRPETYLVQQWFYNDVRMRLRMPAPDVDAFADAQHRVAGRWWGPGGQVEDAMQCDWGVGYGGPGRDYRPLLWVNPPFSMFDAVIGKLVRDKAKAVVICPHWADAEWLHLAMKYVTARYFYRAGTPVFMGVPPTRWPVWALAFDGAVERRWFYTPGDPNEAVPMGHTRSSRRRERRKYKLVEMC